jgi:hypothetical protein
MGFSDPITAGNILIREAIQSPNYVTSVSGWRIAKDGTAEFVGLIIQLGGLIQMSGATAQTPLFTTLVSGDTFARFIINADGGLGWGSGSAIVDTNLYRLAASHLRTDDQFTSGRPLTTDFALTTIVSGDTNDRFIVTAAGAISMGSGSAAQDTNLYRNGANQLRTDDQFTSNRGNNNDIALSTIVAGDSNDRFAISAAGSLDFGDGTNARDTNLYRNGANILRTDDNMQVGGYLEVQGNLGFYGTASIGKPTVTGSRGGNAALASLCTALANLGLITNSTT